MAAEQGSRPSVWFLFIRRSTLAQVQIATTYQIPHVDKLSQSRAQYLLTAKWFGAGMNSTNIATRRRAKTSTLQSKNQGRNMKNWIVTLAATAALTALHAPAQALVNGDFEDGFNGWTVSPHLPSGGALTRGDAPSIGLYPMDSNHTGEPVVSKAAAFQGDAMFDSLSQSISTQSGQLIINFDYALWQPKPFNNSEWLSGGDFMVFVDGEQLHLLNHPNQSLVSGGDSTTSSLSNPVFGSFSFVKEGLAAGTHELKISVGLYALSSCSYCSRQAIDNVSLGGTATAVPEPAQAILFGLGLAGVATARSLRRRPA